MCSVDFTRFAGRVARKKFNARNRLEVNGRAEVADSAESRRLYQVNFGYVPKVWLLEMPGFFVVALRCSMERDAGFPERHRSSLAFEDWRSF